MSQGKVDKACPFCGKQAQLQANNGPTAGWYVVCGELSGVFQPKNGCGARTQLKPIRQEAIDLWNQRVEKE